MPQAPGPRISKARRQIVHASPEEIEDGRGGGTKSSSNGGSNAAAQGPASALGMGVVAMSRPQRMARTGRWRTGIFQELTFRLPVKAGGVAAMSSWNDGRRRRRWLDRCGRAEGPAKGAAGHVLPRPTSLLCL